MKITLIKPEHICECGTSLKYEHNYIRSDAEMQKCYDLQWAKSNWLKKILMLFSHDFDIVDTDRQYWLCPKCFKEYLVDLRKR